MCHVDDTLKACAIGGDAEPTEARLAAAAAYAVRLARAAERDEDAGFAGSWRRVHAVLFGGEGLFEAGLARHIENVARALGRPVEPRPRSVCYADEVTGFVAAFAGR